MNKLRKLFAAHADTYAEHPVGGSIETPAMTESIFDAVVQTMLLRARNKWMRQAESASPEVRQALVNCVRDLEELWA
jgi:hypothetical protein